MQDGMKREGQHITRQLRPCGDVIEQAQAGQHGGHQHGGQSDVELQQPRGDAGGKARADGKRKNKHAEFAE